MADDSTRKEMDALKADIAQLREDIVGLTNTIKDITSEKATNAKSQAKERIREAWEDIEHRFENLLNQGKATYHKAEHQVSEHPVGSVLTAFGLGFIIAKLIDMGSRR